MGRRRRVQRSAAVYTIPQKSARILIIILVAMGLILARIFQLSWIHHDSKIAETKRPKQRVVIEPAKRGTIRDRYNIPLAINKLSYQAGISYAALREIPAISWEKDEHGKKVKRYKRREYIRELAEMLAEELDLDPDRIVDLIYSKAVFYGPMPFILKEDISENTYYRIRGKAKDWPGAVARKALKRHYPQGRVGAEIVGTMGAINREEYEAVMSESLLLKETIEKVEAGEPVEIPEGYATVEEMKARLQQLQERAYSVNDYVGKNGIEARFEEKLRGSYGKYAYHADAQGNALHDLPDARKAQPGQRLLLSISAELQAYAEELLIRSEGAREAYWQTMHPDEVPASGVVMPWIRGGAIVALDPKTGEVLALAGYPRFDPNDFINSGNLEVDRTKWDRINRWFEGEEYFVRIWDGRMPLEREVFDKNAKKSIEQAVDLSWQVYLDMLFPSKYPIRTLFERYPTVGDAAEVQKIADELRALIGVDDFPAIVDALYGEGHRPLKTERTSDRDLLIRLRIEELWTEVYALQVKLDHYWTHLSDNYDKVLFLDLCRVAVHGDYFSDELLAAVGKTSLEHYRNLNRNYSRLMTTLEEQARPLFHDTVFREWRDAHEKEYLKAKRQEEKERNTYNRPYIDYLDKVERQMFAAFWQRARTDLLHCLLFGKPPHDEKLKPFSDTLIAWNREFLKGAHQSLSWRGDFMALRQELVALKPHISYAYLKTFRQYKELDRPLVGKYVSLRSEEGRQYERHLASAFYPKYGFGYARSMAYRQSTVQGSVFKIVTAYEGLVQSYYNKGSLSPLKIFDQVRKVKEGWRVGYFANGTPIPRIYKGGRVPKSLSKNIGETDVVTALERSSNSFFALMSIDVLEAPHDLARAARDFGYGRRTGIDLPGEFAGSVPDNLDNDITGLFAMSIGQGELVVTPLQTAVMLTAFARGGEVLKPKILRLGVEAGAGSQVKPQFGKAFDYDESLQLIGVDFPLFSTMHQRRAGQNVDIVSTEIVDTVDFPDPVREKLFQGMARVVDVIPPVRLSPMYRDWNKVLETYGAERKRFIGKTSSGEVMEVVHLGRTGGVQKITHGWFGGIVFDKERTFSTQTCVPCESYGEPELIVVVYQRFAGAGKYTLPMVSALASKWREIKAKHAEN